MRQAYVRGIILALASATVYGAVPNFARLAFLNGIPALETVLVRTTAVAVILGLVAIVRGEKFKLNRAALPGFCLQCLATLLVSSCYLASLQFLPVTLSVIIFYLFPVLVVLAAPVAEGHFPGMARLLVALLAFAGLGVAIGPAFEHISLLGVLLALLGAVGCALQFFSGRMLAAHLSPAAFGSLVHLTIWPIMLALVLYAGSGKLVLTGAETTLGPDAMWAVSLVAVAYLGGYFFHMSSVRAAPSSVVAPYFNLEPVVSTSLAFLVLGESLTPSQWFGGAMVFAALVIVGLLPERSRP